jgi:hypothetical protein
LGGVDDESGLGMYCEGNGFGTVDSKVNENTLDPDEDPDAISSVKQWVVKYSWDGDDWNRGNKLHKGESKKREKGEYNK